MLGVELKFVLPHYLTIFFTLVQLKGRLIKKEMDDSIEFLSNEGHIYSTVDEDHFKSTEGD
jgi:uncharacterized protein YdeI (BOF family)